MREYTFFSHTPPYSVCVCQKRNAQRQENLNIGRVKLFPINLLKSKWNKFIVDLCVCEWLVEFNGYKRTAKGKKWKIFGLARFSLACVLFFAVSFEPEWFV